MLDLVPCECGEVWGGVYSLDEADWARLDEFEFCAQGGYRRTEIEIEAEQDPGARLRVVAYEVRDKLAVECAPSDEYLATVVAGARQCGLPAAYIESLVADAQAVQRARLTAEGAATP